MARLLAVCAAIERPLLFVLVAVMYLLPGRVPGIPVSLHGLLLLPLLMLAAIAHRDRLFSRAAWPYWALLGVLFLSAAAAGRVGPDAFRPILFGLLTTLSVMAVGRRSDLRMLCFVLVPVLVADAAIGSWLRMTGAPPEALLDLLAGALQRPLHRGAFILLAMLAVGAAYLHTARAWLLLPFTVLALGAISTALRGVWVGAAAGLLVLALLDRRPRALVLLGCAGLTFLAVQERMTARVDETGDLAVALGSGASPRVQPSEPVPQAPSTPSSPARTSPQPSVPAVTQSEAQAASYALDFALKSGPAKFLEELTPAGRMGYWQAAMRMVSVHPILGVGPGNFQAEFPRYASGPRRDVEATSDPHSLFFGILGELGFAGLILLIVLLGAAASRVWRARGVLRERPALTATAAGVAALCAVGLTWDIHVQRIWWLALALLIIASDSESAARPA